MVAYPKDVIEHSEIKNLYKRVKGTSITAEKMHAIKSSTGAVRVFAGGATEIRANISDLSNANIINVPVVIVQSRGVIDFIYCTEPCTFKNEMWGYTASDAYAVKFLFYYLKHNVEFFRNAGDGRSSFSQISLPVTEEYKIPLISSEEQQFITSVLSNFDEYIDNLKKLIEKKKAIRDGALDDLISGKTKLTGFNDESIEYKPIKEVYKRVKGTPITANMMENINVSNGKIRIFAGGSTECRANYEDLPNTEIINEPIVIVQSRGVIDFVYCDEACTFKNEMWGYTSSHKESVKFLFYYLKNNVDYFRNEGSGRSSFSQISLPVTEEYLIPIISTKEQKAIVEILTVMDEEIEALEIQKSKIEGIREGAMDDLLAGRVRLKI